MLDCDEVVPQLEKSVLQGHLVPRKTSCYFFWPLC